MFARQNYLRAVLALLVLQQIQSEPTGSNFSNVAKASDLTASLALRMPTPISWWQQASSSLRSASSTFSGRRLQGRSGCGDWTQIGARCYFTLGEDQVTLPAAKERCKSADRWADVAVFSSTTTFADISGFVVDGEYWIGAQLRFSGKFNNSLIWHHCRALDLYLPHAWRTCRLRMVLA
jgi:hypothetical protein